MGHHVGQYLDRGIALGHFTIYHFKIGSLVEENTNRSLYNLFHRFIGFVFDANVCLWVAFPFVLCTGTFRVALLFALGCRYSK